MNPGISFPPGRAPGGPEIQQDNLTLIIGQREGLAVDVLEGEVQIRHLRIGASRLSPRLVTSWAAIRFPPTPPGRLPICRRLPICPTWLVPVADLDAFPIRAFVHTPPDVATSADHHHFDIIEIGNGRVQRKIQPSGVWLASRAGRSQLIVDDFLVEPIIDLGNSHVLFDPLDQLFLGVEAEPKHRGRHRGIDQQQLAHRAGENRGRR